MCIGSAKTYQLNEYPRDDTRARYLQMSAAFKTEDFRNLLPSRQYTSTQHGCSNSIPITISFTGRNLNSFVILIGECEFWSLSRF